jgi:hypothetical protein
MSILLMYKSKEMTMLESNSKQLGKRLMKMELRKQFIDKLFLEISKKPMKMMFTSQRKTSKS